MNQRVDPALTTRLEIERISTALVNAARAFPAATLHEAAGKTGALPRQIRAMAATFQVCGPAFTVQSPGGDNLWLHRALDTAQPGDILVVHTSGNFDHGYWGEIMSTAAKARRLGGLVIDGCVRDSDLLASIGFPVFARGLCIRGTGKDFGALGWINSPVLVGDIVIRAGDLIVGDRDGVVCVAAAKVESVLDNARKREHDEAQILKRIEAGEATLDVYGWR